MVIVTELYSQFPDKEKTEEGDEVYLCDLL